MATDKRKPTLDDIPSARVIVVGDVIRDIWIHGTVDRISPEAPVPVFLETSREEQPGGAGNVSANLSALGLHGYANALLGREGWKVPLKHRFIVNGQQIFRHDDEETHSPSTLAETDLFARVRGFRNAGCLILSDYGKGTLTPGVCRALIDWAQRNNIPVVVDPKGDDWSKYEGATVITPNEKELTAIKTSLSGFPVIITTLGASGMVVSRQTGPATKIPAQAKEVFDVTGAGDTVVATLGACLAVGFDMETAARIANAAAGVVVGKRGTATCSLDELKDACGGTYIKPSNATDIFTAPLVKKVGELVGLREIAGEEEKHWIGEIQRRLAERPRVRNVDHWERGWKENFDAFSKSGDIADLRPKYIRQRQPIRLGGKFWMPNDPDWEWNWYGKWFDDIAAKWLAGCGWIAEFGSGSGHNLPRLAKLDKAVYGLDWSDYAVKLADSISGSIRGYRFDLLNPSYDFALTGAGVITVGALEQTGKLWRPFMQYLLKQKPTVVVNIEPIVEWYSGSDVDRSAVHAHLGRGFWAGFPAWLTEAENADRVEILHQHRTGIGSLMIEGYSINVWRPI